MHPFKLGQCVYRANVMPPVSENHYLFLSGHAVKNSKIVCRWYVGIQQPYTHHKIALNLRCKIFYIKIIHVVHHLV